MVLEEKERTCCSSCSKTDKLTSIYISIIGPIGHGKGILYHNCSLLPFPRKCKWSSLCWIMTSWGRTKPSVRSLWVTMPPAQSWGTGLICWPTLVAPLPSGTLWNLKRRWTPLLGRTNRQLHLPASPPEHSKWSRAIDTSVRQRFVFCSALFCFSKLQYPFSDGCRGILDEPKSFHGIKTQTLLLHSCVILSFACPQPLHLFLFKLKHKASSFSWVFHLRSHELQLPLPMLRFDSLWVLLPLIRPWDFARRIIRAWQCELTRSTVLVLENIKGEYECVLVNFVSFTAEVGSLWPLAAKGVNSSSGTDLSMWQVDELFSSVRGTH